MCLYLTFDYLCNQVAIGAKKIQQFKQLEMGRLQTYFRLNEMVGPSKSFLSST